jgi:hypothetical protein
VVLKLRDVVATRERTRAAGAAAFVAKRRTEGILLAATKGAALANARWMRHEGPFRAEGGTRRCRA